MNRKIKIPRIPHAFFKWYCREERYEELHGDLEELFYERVAEDGLAKARRRYLLDVIRCFQPYAWRKPRMQTTSNMTLFNNYFKVSMRGLMKTPLNSFINIFGLAMAIGICIFGYAFARWTYSTDQFHKNKNEVFLTTFFADRDGTVQQFGKTPRPLGEMLREDFVHIKKICRVEDGRVVMKYGDNVFHERVRYTDPAFLDMFTFPLKWGMSHTLSDLNSIILSEKMSIKYFGDENPIGQSMLMKFDEHTSKVFKVTGVAAAFPKALTIKFDFLINFENLRTAHPDYDFHDWSAFVNATLIQVDNPSDIKSIQQKMEKYRIVQNKAVQRDWAISAFAFEPLATLHERSEYIRDDISWSSASNYKSVLFLALVAFFLLALACFNYINIAIVSAAKRLKEIGVRKSIGATRRIIIVQFLSENIITTFFALIMGLIMAKTIFIPWFEQMWNFSFDFRFNDKNLWLYLPCILLLTGIASGIYPAFYISRFQVTGILKGAVKFGNKNPVTKLFLGAQLILACILITGGVMFTQNASYMSTRSWGYDQHEALYASVPDKTAFEKLNAAMIQAPNVLSISGSHHHLGKASTATVLHMPDREYEVDRLSVDAHYFETMGLRLKAGRVFNDHEGSDSRAVVINELMAKNMAWKQPIGELFEIDSVKFEVIGVLKDFHNYSFDEALRPTIFTLAAKTDYRYLSLKVRPGSETEAYNTLQTQWAKLYPEIPFQGGFQEDAWGHYYEEHSIYGQVWRGFASIAVLLASLGLYGLMTLNVAGRSREFSIRKVLGADFRSIAGNVTNQYAILFAVALAMGAPVSYTLMKLLFNSSFPYHMPLDISGVAFAVTLLILVLLMTVSTQIRKVLKANPVDGLKVE